MSFLFHQAADELEVGFPVLQHEIPRLIGALQIQLEGDAALGKHATQDIRNAQILKRAAAAGPREQPELRHDLDPIERALVR